MLPKPLVHLEGGEGDGLAAHLFEFVVGTLDRRRRLLLRLKRSQRHKQVLLVGRVGHALARTLSLERGQLRLQLHLA